MRSSLTSTFLEFIRELIDQGETFEIPILVNKNAFVVQPKSVPEDALILDENLEYKGVKFSVYLPAD